MTIFYQHVGERGGNRDFPKTIGRPNQGLVNFQLDNVPELTAGLDQDATQALEAEIRRQAPEGFQLWGIPSGAKSVLSTLRKGHWLLLLESDGPGGQFYYGGQVIYRPDREMHDLSRRLWGEARFPLIVLLHGRLTDYPWERFRMAFGFAPNWRLAGNTYRLAPDRIARSPFATEADVIAAVLGAAVEPSQPDGTFTDLMDQVELHQQSLEGRRRLREHLVRERDPAMIRMYKAQLSSFTCSVCSFDFEQMYGAIGRGFIEAHHLEPVGSRQGNTPTTIRDFVSVCSNCHRMLHRQVPPYTIQDLSSLMARAFEMRGNTLTGLNTKSATGETQRHE
jgi:hypothetical protein